MEAVYMPKKFPCTEKMNLKSYFEKFVSACSFESCPNLTKLKKRDKTQAVLDYMKVFDKDRRKQISTSCSIDLLIAGKDAAPLKNAPNQQEKVPINRSVTNENTLRTLKIRQKYGLKMKNLYENQRARKGTKLGSDSSIMGQTNIQLGAEFAVAIRLYHPYQALEPIITKSYKSLKFSHEIVMLGTHTLADLRDKILCQADAGLCMEISQPDLSYVPVNAKEKYPSGFIFIDDVFYNDTRHNACIDYSEVIMKWAQQKNIGPLRKEDLEKTKINELTPRFGYPYVYQHQANCEHVLVFSDAWLLTRKDTLNRQDYPFYRAIERLRSKKCSMCYATNAKWICTESDRLPHTQTFLCHNCLMQYNYNKGEKVGEFKIFPYFDKGHMLF